MTQFTFIHVSKDWKIKCISSTATHAVKIFLSMELPETVTKYQYMSKVEDFLLDFFDISDSTCYMSQVLRVGKFIRKC